jgi:glycosyltransferase involved in cell wall biosynthesis
LFSGYDAVDNEHFSRASLIVRRDAEGYRQRYALPSRYILSLGRLVEKKNLKLLVAAFAQLSKKPDPAWLSQHHRDSPALVFVGSGDQEPELLSACASYGLRVVDRRGAPDVLNGGHTGSKANERAVYFYGFRQIEENPIFFALADLFVLPSLYEEWGLVVNEAMACGLPVIVSKTAGCSEDLVEHGVNGFTFDPGSSSELTAKLAEIVSDKSAAERMGLRSSAIISKWGCDNFATQALRAADAAQQ